MKNVNLIDVTSYSYNIENIGLEYITSYLRHNSIEVKLSSLNADKQIDKLVEDIDLNYDIYGFSMFITNIDIIFSMARYIKSKTNQAKIFVGGRFATSAFKGIMEECEAIDFIILGDGENPILNVVKALSCNETIDELPSVVTRITKTDKKPAIVNFYNEVWPARDLLEGCIKRELFSARILTSRGCCANCTFCCQDSFTKFSNTPQWVGREMEDVFNELMLVYNTYHINSFFFNDGSFEDPGEFGKDRILKLCNLILSQPVKFIFYIFVRAESFNENDIELLKIMKKAGFYSVFIGIESVNRNDLRIFNKNANVEDNKRAYDLFTSLGFSVNPGFIMINPWSSKVSISENFEFLCNIHFSSTEAYISRLQIYYDSDIYHTLKKENMLKKGRSYRDLFNYEFIDPFIEELNEFISKYFINNAFSKEERDYVVFYNRFYELDFLYPEKTSKYRKKISTIKEKYFTVLKEYFFIIFIDNDLKLAEEVYEVFIRKARAVLKEFNILKFKIISDKELFSYFRRAENSIQG